MSEKVLSQQQVDFFNKSGYLIVAFGLSMTVLDQVVRDLESRYPRNGDYHAFGRRLSNAWMSSQAVRTIALHEAVLDALRQLFGRRARPFQTLNFPTGTQQPMHSDTLHFNSKPAGYMAGVWFALEDVDENNGPLQYYPGSHQLKEITMQDAGVPAHPRHYALYEDYIAKVVEREHLKPEYALLRKGEAFIWHGNLIHGGASHKVAERTRHSQVTHYFFEGCRYYTPLHSMTTTRWRRPYWVHEPNLFSPIFHTIRVARLIRENIRHDRLSSQVHRQ